MHEFSIYFKYLNDFILGVKSEDEIIINDFELKKRLIDVLRLKDGECFLLFDDKQNVKFILLGEKNKRELKFKVVSINKNKITEPEIILCSALLKKKTFQEVLSSAAAMSVCKIYPLITSKIHKNWIDQKNIDRLHKIIISACEQAKNFVVPKLEKTVELKMFLDDQDFKNTKVVCFHVAGKPLFKLLSDLNQKKYKKIYLFFGPEADFSQNELELFKKNNIEFYRLTNTILRSVDAISVGLGSVASVAK